MNIGFEAKRAFVNDTGLGQYSRTLASSLAQYYPQHQYFLFTPKAGSLFSTLHRHNMHTVLPSKPLHRLWPSLWRSHWVTQDLKKLQIDLYHGLSHEIPHGIHKTGIPTIVTIHDLIHERYPEQYAFIDRKIYSRKFKYACHHAQKVIAISRQTKDDIVDFYGIDEAKIEVCYQSCHPMYMERVDEDTRQMVRQRYQLPKQYLLYVGSIIERKNLLTICKALQHLQRDTQVPLVVIGKGKDYRQQVVSFLEEAGLDKQVIFLSYQSQLLPHGHIDAKDFPAIYQMAAMLIYPSFFEGFGIPVLEALWSKTPVITSNVSCLPEAGGDGAFYVNPHDAIEMAQTIHLILHQPGKVQAQIEKGYRYAQHFTNEKTAAHVYHVYETLMK
jgi:glycosyltransferase involved in cell wall biosynthesis